MTSELSAGASDFVTTLEDLARMFLRLPSNGRLSLSTVAALRTIGRNGPMRLSDLTASEHVTQPAMTQIVSRLEKDNLVERRPDPDDGRAVLVQITRHGTEFIAARHSDRVARLTDIFEHLTPEERSEIVAALPALRRVAALQNNSKPTPTSH